jgi:DNA-binding transcriptional LysR family regulator
MAEEQTPEQASSQSPKTGREQGPKLGPGTRRHRRWTLRDLRVFATAAQLGSFTDAAAELYISQAAVSRTIAGLEAAVGERLLLRTARGCEPTGVGLEVLEHARRLLLDAQHFDDFLATRGQTLRLGYSWAGLGRHTASFIRAWESAHPGIGLELVRYDSASAGLAEGRCDVAIVRAEPHDPRFDTTVVGLERRMAAFASDDAQWARRRKLSMAELAGRTVLVDPHTGTTSAALWPAEGPRPRTRETHNIDAWLDAIAAGRGIGTTSEATEAHHGRAGITFRPVKDGPPIAVRLMWWRGQAPPQLAELVAAVSGVYAG